MLPNSNMYQVSGVDAEKKGKEEEEGVNLHPLAQPQTHMSPHILPSSSPDVTDYYSLHAMKFTSSEG
jgi:hypothetical protein